MGRLGAQNRPPAQSAACPLWGWAFCSISFTRDPSKACGGCTHWRREGGTGALPQRTPALIFMALLHHSKDRINYLVFLAAVPTPHCFNSNNAIIFLFCLSLSARLRLQPSRLIAYG